MAFERRVYWALLSVSAIAVLFSPVGQDRIVKPAYAAMAVIDSANLAKNAETAAKTVELLANAKAQLDRLVNVEETLGLEGLGDSLEAAQRLFKLSRSGNRVLGSSRILQTVRPHLPDGAGDALDTIASARRTVENLYVPSPKASEVNRLQMEETRRTKARQASQDALAAAWVNRRTASELPTRLETLAEAAEEAAKPDGNLRQQVAVLTSGIMMLTEEMAQLRGLVAIQVEMQASRNIGDSPLAMAGPPDLGPGKAADTRPPGSSGVFE